MATVTVNDQYLTDIANAIRYANIPRKDDTFKPAEMAAAIRGARDWIIKDGKTRLWLEIDNALLLTQQLAINVNSLSGLIDWGDGTTSSTLAAQNTYTHTYGATGTYVITITHGGSNMASAPGSSACIMGTRSKRQPWLSCLKRVEIGERFPTIGAYTFQYCFGLREVYVPKTTTTFNTQVFRDCRGLNRMIFEDGHPGFNTASTLVWYNNYGLIDGTFYGKLTGATVQAQTFQNCLSLLTVTIPAQVTTINANAFNGLTSLHEIHVKPTTPPTVANANAFTSLNADCKIYVPTASLATYQAANIWSTYASQMVGE